MRTAYPVHVPLQNKPNKKSLPTEHTAIGMIMLSVCLFVCDAVHFYCSANAIFGKVGRVASEEVVLQLIKIKCIPSILYGLEACSL